MHLHGTSKIAPDGHLMIGGVSAVTLAQHYGTPLIVYDEQLIRTRMHEYLDPLQASGASHAVVYACKAFTSLAMCRLAAEQGLWLDVVSAGELHTALTAKVDPSRILMHGNNKTESELQMAVEARIGLIVVDNFDEIERLAGITAHAQQRIQVLLRVAPGVDAHTHEYIATGKQDSKFGFDLHSGQVQKAVQAIHLHPSLHLMGLHSHIGSQIFDVEGFRVAAERMAGLYAQIEREFGISLSILNLGGGLGVRYTEEDMMPPIDHAVSGILDATQTAFTANGLALPMIMFEPGRSLVAEAGTTLYRVGSRKDIPSIRSYVAVDGGMTDNPRLALYGARYEACLANRMLASADKTVSIAGKCCESGDMLIWDAVLPNPEPGDLLAVSCTGAYNYSMASNYNRMARPAVVFVRDGQARLVLRRETLADLISLDVDEASQQEDPHSS